jgi:hypothetical protein
LASLLRTWYCELPARGQELGRIRKLAGFSQGGAREKSFEIRGNSGGGSSALERFSTGREARGRKSGSRAACCKTEETEKTPETKE